MTATITNETGLTPSASFPTQRPVETPSRDRQRTAQALSDLKDRLLQSRLAQISDAELVRLLRLAAGEAEALAWQTPFPLLLLPVLLEEKLEAGQTYLARQERVSGSARPSLHGSGGGHCVARC
jgi:hypothetical protein